MRAIKLKDHDTEEELLQEIRNTKNGRYQYSVISCHSYYRTPVTS